MIELLLGIPAVYYLTLVVTEYDGTARVFLRLRSKFEEPFTCFVCMSFWIALLVASLMVCGLSLDVNVLLLAVGYAGIATLIWELKP